MFYWISGFLPDRTQVREGTKNETTDDQRDTCGAVNSSIMPGQGFWMLDKLGSGDRYPRAGKVKGMLTGSVSRKVADICDVNCLIVR